MEIIDVIKYNCICMQLLSAVFCAQSLAGLHLVFVNLHIHINHNSTEMNTVRLLCDYSMSILHENLTFVHKVG